MHHPLSDVASTIQRHRQAVVADEASFTDDGVAHSQAQADITGAAEVAAFRAFVSVQCETSEDASRKLNYLLNGTVGERDRLIDCLSGPRHCPDDVFSLAEEFLRSLIPPASSGVGLYDQSASVPEIRPG